MKLHGNTIYIRIYMYMYMTAGAEMQLGQQKCVVVRTVQKWWIMCIQKP